MPAGFLGAIFAPVGGRLLDTHGPKRPVVAGITLMLVAILAFTIMARQLNNAFITLVYCLYMAGMGMLMGTALSTLSGAQSPQGNAILNTLQQFAGSMGTSLVAMIVAKSQVGVGKTPAATAMGTSHAFVLMLVFAIIIYLCVLKFVPKKISK